MELLNDMALFVEVVKAHSFRGAAAALGMPNSTLSRRIGLLEQAIGLRLLNRTTRRIELTEAGQIYFDRCKRIVDEARLAHEQLGEMLAQPSGLLRVSLPVDFAAAWLAPRLGEFTRLYPGIGLEFDLTPRRVDLVSEPVDLAIRMGDLPDSGLIARQLALLPRGLYASPGYLAAQGAPTAPADLAAHDCLRMRNAEPVWRLSRGAQTVAVPVTGRFSLNNVGMMRQLAGLDLGIAVLSEDIAAADLDTGRLIRLLPDWQASPVAVHALTETRLLPAKTQRFIDFLRDCMARPSRV